jgi:single-strand DNA-binding protein
LLSPNFDSSNLTSGENDQSIFHTKTTNIMNALRNKVQLIGNLGAKVEIKTLESGKAVGHVTIATNEVYKNQKGEKVTETTWHNLVIWGKNAELLDKYTDKGSEIAIEGKLTNRSYTDKEGIKRYITEVVVNEILLMTNKSAKAETAPPF